MQPQLGIWKRFIRSLLTGGWTGRGLLEDAEAASAGFIWKRFI